MSESDDEFWKIVRTKYMQAFYSHGLAPRAGMLDWAISEVRAGTAEFDQGPIACCEAHTPQLQQALGRVATEHAVYELTLAVRIWLASDGNPPLDPAKTTSLRVVAGGKT